ncbi:MAG: hypothetical protein CMM52_16805 [Rhodospirillaceae bacterium]|nr:hypothetical protein [Rhodospirillaceae bacterium]|tara:strand:- start:38440 stop:38913 length:474 start_codon:yes stop_codon:yes gene_type:complete
MAAWNHQELRCALGNGGISATKQEGDGVTPAGVFSLRRVLYRPDRIEPPKSILPVSALTAADGWCDEPGHPKYNQQISTPFGGHHENLWREDGLYDVIAIVGHNDDPIVSGAGSAIFLHVAKPDFSATEGCVAFSRTGLLKILDQWNESSLLDIRTE